VNIVIVLTNIREIKIPQIDEAFGSDPTSTESEPHIPLLPAFASDYMQFLELITFPQRSALELLFTQPH